LKNGNELASTERLIIRSTEKYSSIELNNIDAGDRGNYTCIASNAAGSDSFTAVLDVKREMIYV
jgi:hypothetical protein